ncbi:proton extrusion protein PcxA [Phormidium tenue FACHB-886]|nr:proton extrusion protein PcxA [Phormidium tenue FACHB-886]
MSNSFLTSVRGYLRGANRWLLRTPERSLNEAYEAAIMIKGLEDAHFGGNRVAFEAGNYSRSAQNYFESELRKYLEIIRIRLIEFRASSSILRISSQVSGRPITDIEISEATPDGRSISIIDRPNSVLKKLRFIDEILSRYENRATNPLSPVVVSEPKTLANPNAPRLNAINNPDLHPELRPEKRSEPRLTDKTGVLPRSILDTVDRLKRDLDFSPESEREIIQTFRSSKSRTFIATRFLLLLILIPLLTQQISKNFVISPIVDHFRTENATVSTFLNSEMEEEALNELQHFEQRLRFEVLIGKVEPQEETEIVEQVREKAAEIEEDFRQRSADAIKNVFADLLALGAFATVIVSSKREISILKTFMDELVYGLSDSAKAFIIILFTDIFVGFHSPHGWEVLLEGAAKHLGLPPNHDFIFLFIATFPVILDTIFKYWIFRYLNRVSPSAVATYKTMNE